MKFLPGSLVSFQRVAKIFEVSLDLAKSYCQYLQEAFIVDFVGFYSRKAAERQRNPHKVYAVDLGLRQVVSLSQSEDNGRLIETVVFHALQAQKNDGIFYWKKQNEIDFMVRKGIAIKDLIQATESLEDPVVVERELRSLSEAKSLFPQADQKIIVGKISKQLLQDKKISVLPFLYYLISQ